MTKLGTPIGAGPKSADRRRGVADRRGAVLLVGGRGLEVLLLLVGALVLATCRGRRRRSRRWTRRRLSLGAGVTVTELLPPPDPGAGVAGGRGRAAGALCRRRRRNAGHRRGRSGCRRSRSRSRRRWQRSRGRRGLRAPSPSSSAPLAQTGRVTGGTWPPPGRLTWRRRQSAAENGSENGQRRGQSKLVPHLPLPRISAPGNIGHYTHFLAARIPAPRLGNATHSSIPSQPRTVAQQPYPAGRPSEATRRHGSQGLNTAANTRRGARLRAAWAPRTLPRRASRSRGGDAVGDLANALLDNPVFSQALRPALGMGEKAAQAQQAAMDAVGLPSAEELDRLERRVRSLSDRIEALEDQIDRIAARRQRHAPPARRPAPRSPLTRRACASPSPSSSALEPGPSARSLTLNRSWTVRPAPAAPYASTLPAAAPRRSPRRRRR